MSQSYLARDIASRLHHSASYVSQQYNDLMADLREIAGTDLAEQRIQFGVRSLETLAAYGFEPAESQKPFAYADGVAIIPIHGLLVNRLSWSCSWATGYNFIRSQLTAALADPDVKMIVYDVNSPGGIASGCAELAQEMFDSRAQKPSMAVIDARCYSAAYFLASAATRIVVTPSGGVGSIGCVSMHVDYSASLDEQGVKVTFIIAGNQKVDGNPYQSLSKRALATIQRDVDYHYGLFVQAVARQRDLSEDDIRATEAACFLPPEALDLGLIDAVETPAEAVANFFNQLTSDSEGGDDVMTTQNGTAGAAAVVAAPAVAGMTQADVDAAVARALTADRERQSAIRNCPEAEGRTALANHLADKGMSIDDAKGILAAAPKEAPQTATPAAAGSAFAAAMNNTPNPNVGADGTGGAAGTGAESETSETIGARLLGSYSKATGHKVKTIEHQAA